MGQDQDVRDRDESVRDAINALQISERRHRLLAEHANDVIWTMGIDGTITYVSPAVQAMRGITPQEAMAQSIEQIHPPESAAISVGYFTELYRRLQEGLPPHEFRGELEYYCRDGSTIWTEVQVIPHLSDEGQLLEILGVTRDISSRRTYEAELKQARDDLAAVNTALAEANERLARLARVDDLTDAWNRRHFEELAARELSRAARRGGPLALLMIDLDHFKRINDVYGHQVGDGVLVDTVASLSRTVRAEDVVARWGGEEFVVLLPGCSHEQALESAERIRRTLAGLITPVQEGITASIGVADWSLGEELRGLVARADTAMYAAKNAGRNAVRSA